MAIAAVPDSASIGHQRATARPAGRKDAQRTPITDASAPKGHRDHGLRRLETIDNRAERTERFAGRRSLVTTVRRLSRPRRDAATLRRTVAAGSLSAPDVRAQLPHGRVSAVTSRDRPSRRRRLSAKRFPPNPSSEQSCAPPKAAAMSRNLRMVDFARPRLSVVDLAHDRRAHGGAKSNFRTDRAPRQHAQGITTSRDRSHATVCSPAESSVMECVSADPCGAQKLVIGDSTARYAPLCIRKGRWATRPRPIRPPRSRQSAGISVARNPSAKRGEGSGASHHARRGAGSAPAVNASFGLPRSATPASLNSTQLETMIFAPTRRKDRAGVRSAPATAGV